MRLRPADESDIAYVESLLEANDLPTADVRSKPECFYVAYDGETAVGIGGIESVDAVGLLRSVVVVPSVRGDGVGTAVCDALEEEARAEGVETLYLLTTTAAEFFADRGYEETDRTDAPEAIRRTAEFNDLCPASAVCMKKSVA